MGVVDEFIKDPVLPINWNALTKISNQRLNRVDYAAVSIFVWPEPVEPFPECLCFQGETPLEDAAAALSVCHWPPSWLVAAVLISNRGDLLYSLRPARSPLVFPWPYPARPARNELFPQCVHGSCAHLST